jgi:hypothetical protein
MQLMQARETTIDLPHSLSIVLRHVIVKLRSHGDYYMHLVFRGRSSSTPTRDDSASAPCAMRQRRATFRPRALAVRVSVFADHVGQCAQPRRHMTPARIVQA